MTDTLTIIPLADLKAHMNVTISDDDSLLVSILEAARAFVEGWCGPLDDFVDGVPADLVQALKMHAAHLYENREATSYAASAAEVPMGFFPLIDRYRLREF